MGGLQREEEASDERITSPGGLKASARLHAKSNNAKALD